VVRDQITGLDRVVGNHRIRRVDARTGVISTLAGTGDWDFTGDGGPATAAALSFPAAVAVDASGRVLISDAGNHRVRAIDPATGRISTFAGVGGDPFSGLGAYAGDGGPAAAASLNIPVGLAVDPQGNLFIADQANHRVRRVDARTGVIVTVAGTGQAGLSGDGGLGLFARLDTPAGLALLPSGDLLIADLRNARVRRLSSPNTLLPYAGAQAALDFGSVTVQTPRRLDVILRNRGNAPLKVQRVQSSSPLFTARDTSLTVAVADSAALPVAFTPAAPGRAEGQLTITTDDPRGPITVLLSGRGTVPDIDLAPQSLNFGPVVLGKPDTLSLTVYNFGIGQLFVSSVASSDAQFAVLDSAFVLASGLNRTLRVVFSPGALDEQVAALTLRSNDPDEGTVSVRLRGVGRPSRPGGFQAVGDSAGLGGPGREFGVAWGDFNGDGRPDLYVARSGGRPASLHRNNGDGTFTDVAAEAGVTNDRDGSAAVWGDFDGDGDLDLFVTNFNQPNRLYRNDSGKFTDIAPALGLDDPGAGMGAAWADFDNDGDLDLFVANFGPSRLYRNEGARFTDIAPALGVADSLGSSVQPAWGDYNGDGRIDLYVAASGKDHLYRNDGARFVDVGDSLRVVDSAPSFGAAWGDFDNDSDLDLFVTGFNASSHLYRNDHGRFTGVDLLKEDDGTWKARGAVWVDYDNDGDLDLYLVRSGQPNLLYRNDSGSFVEVGAKLGVNSVGDGRGVAVADFDGDGAPDLYVSNQDRPGRLYRNREAEGGWVAARLVGTRSTKDAIGARVRAVVNGLGLLQEVSGGASHLSQSGATLLFGVGRAERVDSLTVRWPSGIVQALKDLPAGRLTRIEETPPSPPVRVALTASATSLIANGVSTARITATVLDEQGERVLSSRAAITFTLASGQGTFQGPASVQAQDGLASITFRSPDLVPGRAVILAQSPGLANGQAQIDLLPPPQAGAVRVAAGNGQAGWSGDGGPSAQAALNLPEGVAVADTTGTLYIADTENSRVRRVDGRTNVIATVVGTGVRGSRGDGGPAAEAQLSVPSEVLVTRDNRLLIVDTGNNKVRQVDLRTSIITTLVGDGRFGFAGDGGPAAEASLSQPASVVLDRQGNLYIADSFNHRIRRLDAATGLISTVAGDGQARFAGDGGPAFRASLNRPSGVALDSLGNLYIADSFNHRIRRLDTATGLISTVAGDGQTRFAGDGGLATDASLNRPRRVALDSLSNLYIADADNHRIRRVDARSGLIVTVAGTGTGGFNGLEGQDATKLDLNQPAGLSPGRPGELFVADARNHLIRRVQFRPEAPPGPAAGADFNGDKAVDFTDFFMFVEQFGTRQGGAGWDPAFDLAQDGVIDFNDFFVFAEQFGTRLNKWAAFSP
jgi:sugar lactone lactonase YvrE